MTELIIVGDEAATREEWEAHDRNKNHWSGKAEHNRRYRAENPDYWRRWREANPDRMAMYRLRAQTRYNLPCPGPRCLTKTPGGRLCHFCRRTP